MKKLTLLLLLALSQQNAFAAIYKCEQNGKTQYQATHCAKKSEASTKIKLPPQPSTSISEAKPLMTKRCKGQEMSINFSDMPLKTTLELIANYSGNKLVTDSSVSGSGAFNYVCTPWEVVLQDIAKEYNLSYKIKNGTISAGKR